MLIYLFITAITINVIFIILVINVNSKFNKVQEDYKTFAKDYQGLFQCKIEFDKKIKIKFYNLQENGDNYESDAVIRKI